MPDEPTSPYLDGYIEGVEETIEAFARAGVARETIYKVVRLMGTGPQARKRLWDKLNQISASQAHTVR